MLTNPLVDPAVGAPQSLKADSGTARIPLNILPASVKPGDRISLTVTGIDAISSVATVVADNALEAVPPPAGENKDVVDTSLTMGPMDDLKSYLYQKTMSQDQGVK
jgi:hypothetical protein